jgi:hypothetical protein
MLAGCGIDWTLCGPRDGPTTAPVGHLLRDQHRDRWVRFHSLPESKRYPDSEEEYATVLARHHAVLDELGLHGRCYVLSALFADDLMPPPPAESTLLPRAVHWRTVPPVRGEELEIAVYATESHYPSGELDALLRAVVEEELVGMIIAPPDDDWLYHRMTAART